MAESVKSVLVQGIPEHIDNSTAVEQLTIHFQKHVISGRDAEVDAVHLVQLPPNQRAFVVVFGNGEESVNAVLQKKQIVHNVDFDGNLVQLSVTACPLNIEAGVLPSSTRLNMGEDFNNPKQDSLLDDSTTEEGENRTNFVPDETVKYPNIQEGTPDSEQSARYPPAQFSAENYGFYNTSGRDFPADSSARSSMAYPQQVTERVLGCDLVLDGVHLTVRQPKISDTDEDTIQVDPCKLEVTGFKEGTSQEIVEMYFESRNRSGGGTLVKCEMKDDETYIITYESPEVAECVLSQEKHVLEGRPLIVKQFQPTREKKNHHEQSDHEDTIQVDPCKLEVTGFKEGTSQEIVEMYFESRNRSGGGTLVKCEMKDDETYIITYESPEVAECVLSQEKHVLAGRPLIVKQFQPTREKKKHHEQSDHEESDSEEEEANCTIEVTGFPPDTSTETLELYFESKRSGGGPIESKEVINGVLVITFESPDDAARVLERQNHKISQMKLTVREPAKKKKKPKLPRDRQSFLLRGLADGTKREHLELYLETCTGIEGDAELLFGEEPDVVLVRYDEEIEDFENIKKKIGKKKLNKAKITVEPVHLTNCIMVKNLPPNVTDDTLELYFEAKKKSGGGEVVEVDMKEDTGTALVSFKDYKVLDSVLSRQHKVYKKAIEVQPYYECLGEVVSSDEPPARIPDPITIKAHPNVLNYITSKPQYLEELKKSLSKVYAQHEWPAAGSNDSILIIPSFPEEVENRHQKYKEWPKTVNEALSKFLKNFKCADVSVLEGIWLQVISQKAGWATGEVEVIDDQNSSRILITGRLERVEQVEDKVNQDIEDQMQKANDHGESDSEEEEANCTIEVTGFPPDTSTETLELYFESKRSGGGPIESKEVINGVLVITFESPDDAARVLERQNHKISQMKLTVREPAKKKKKPKLPRDRQSFLLRGLADGTKREHLELYLETCTGIEGDAELLFGEEPDVVLVRYDEEIEDFENIKKKIGKKKLNKAKITVEPVHLTNCIMVKNLPPNVTDDTLELYFEAKKKSGGGEVVEVDMKEDTGTALVSFKDYKVLDSVLSRQHKVYKKAIEVQPYYECLGEVVSSDEPPARIPDPITIKAHPNVLNYITSKPQYLEELKKSLSKVYAQHEWPAAGSNDSILIIPSFPEEVENRHQKCKEWPKTVNEALSKFLKNFKCADVSVLEGIWLQVISQKAGWATGEVEVIDDQNSSRILITGRLERVEQVEDKVNQDIEDQMQKANDHGESDSEEEEANCTIEVTGFPPDTSTETLELYFESKRSGGGPIESKEVINGVLVITFESPDDAARVLERQNHKISQMKLTVREPAKKKKKPKLPRDRQSFLLRGLADGTKREHLELYLETCTGIEGDAELLFGEEPDVVLVRYDEEIEDFENIKKKIGKKKLNKAKITVEPVHLTNCIMVKNLPPNVTDDTLELYFEAKKKSGGGEVVEVDMKEDTGIALVSFKDYKVLDSVLSRQHKVNKKAVQVQPYYECLGEVVSSDEPPARIPDPITIKAHPNVLNYITSKPQYLEELKKSLSKVYAQHEWPAAGSNDSILIIPSFPEEVENRHQKCKEWPKTVNEALSKFLKNFKCADVPVLEDIWLQVISQKAGWATGEVEVIDDQNSSRILITGRLERVEQVEDKVNQVIKDIEDQMQKAKRMIKESQKLDILTIKQLLMCNFSKTAMAKYPDLTVKVTLKSKQISFHGLPNDVNAAKCDMYETMCKMPKMSFKPPTQSYVEFLQLPDVSQRIYDMFKQSKIQAIYFVGDDGIVLSAMSHADLATASRIMKGSIVEEKIQLQPRSLPAIQKQEWQKLVTQLQEDHVTKIDIPKGDKKTVLIIGFQTEIQTVLAQLKDYIAVNTEVDESVKIESGRMKYIDAYKKDVMVRIEKGAQRLPLQINRQTKESFVLLTIRGTEDDVKVAAKALSQLADSVCRRTYPVDKPGLAKHIREEKGKFSLKMVEDRWQCKIDVSDPSEGDYRVSGDDNDDEGFENVSMAQPTTYHILCYHTMANGRRIVVGKGDLTKMHVDAIVSAANGSLTSSTGGLAKAITDAGGPDIQGECSQIIRQRGRLYEGEAVPTGPGNLSCKAIIHAVSPVWHGSSHSHWSAGHGQGKEERLLTDAVCSSLKIAEQFGHTSIGIPAIGSGGLGFPLDLCVKTIIGAVDHYCSFSKPKSLMEIRFVDNSDATCQQFQDELVQFYRGNVVITSEEESQGQNLFTDIQKSRHQWQMMIGNICVQVQEGDITAETTAAIVNSSNEDLNLSHGAVSIAIVKSGGRTIVDECQQLGRQKPGTAVITGAGKLRCSNIIHLVSANKENLEKSIMSSLMLAEQSGIKSLAMPAIGTGKLGIDSRDVANKTFQVIRDFFQKVHPRNLRLIRITIFQQDIVDIFRRAMTDSIAMPQTQDGHGAVRRWIGGFGSAVKQDFLGQDKKDHRQATPKQWNTIILDIYAGSPNAIDEAIKSIEKTMEIESTELMIDTESVRKLSGEDMSCLRDFAETISVKVEIVDTGSVRRLRIQGGPRDVMQVQEKANTLLDRIHAEERLESEAKLMAKNVKWVFMNENEQLEEYDPLTTGFIEKAYANNKKDVIVYIEGGRYKINFSTMTEIDLDDLSSIPLEVRRELKTGGVPLPSAWKKMASNEQVKSVVLDDKSPEYNYVVKHFKQTLGSSYVLKKIFQIVRIQNPRLYRQYVVLKQDMDSKNPPGTQNEKMLYHGTRSGSVSKINAGGFNRSFAGKNATYFGDGSYFAVNASYSASGTYSRPDDSGKKYMYQAKVLTGEYTKGAQGMKVPPSKNPNNSTDCYDSVTNNEQKPEIFVVFNDAMAYPEYLIVFQ